MLNTRRNKTKKGKETYLHLFSFKTPILYDN